MYKPIYIENQILSVLRGRDKKLTAREIKALIGIESSDLRHYVNNLRVHGYWICSDGRGYWLTEDIEEIQNTIRSLGSRVNKIRQAQYGLMKSLNRKVK